MDFLGTDRHRTMYLESSERLFGRSFLEVFPFSEGKGSVRDKSGAYFIGTDGRPCFREKYIRAYPFHDGISAVCDELGMFHIDSDGKPLYKRKFAWVSDYHDGLCAVRCRNGEWTFIDREGNPRDRRYGYCSDFGQGRAVVSDDGGFYHIDTSGRPLYDHRFQFCRNFSNGRAPVMENNVWHLIDSDGIRASADLDRIDGGRNGLFAAVKGDEFGYITMDGSFRTLFGLTEPDDKAPMPQWADDLKNFEWDSCVVFARHAERCTHFLCNQDMISRSDITSEGQRFAREIGTYIRGFGDRTIRACCSPIQRCVSTANCILGGIGVPSEIEVCPEIGPRGSAFFCDDFPSDDKPDRPTSVLCIDHLNGTDLDGWYPNRVIRDRIIGLVKGYLDADVSLTFCINHDVYVIPTIAYVTGRFPRDQWLDYCDGLLFLRKGDRYSAVYGGREYPLDPKGVVEIDTMKKPSKIEMDLPDTDDDRSWDWQTADDTAWVGEDTEIAVTGCDRGGRFFFGRNDGHLLTSRMFSFAGDFREQTAPIYIEGKGATHITDFGDILHNRWFKECREFGEGLAPVRNGTGWHYADVDGRVVPSGTYDLCDPVFHGESFVMKGSIPYVRLRDGSLIRLRSGRSGPTV